MKTKMAFKVNIYLTLAPLIQVVLSLIIIVRLILLAPTLIERARRFKDKIILNVFYSGLMAIVGLSLLLFYIRALWNQVRVTKHFVIILKENLITLRRHVNNFIFNIIWLIRRIQSTIFNIKAVHQGANGITSGGVQLGIGVWTFVQAIRGVIRGSELLVQGLYGFLHLAPRGLKSLHKGVTGIIGGITGLLHGVSDVAYGINNFFEGTREFGVVTKRILYNR